jgi:AcrR family transcriptional regulator
VSQTPSPAGGTRERILDAVLASLKDGDEDVVNMAAVARRAGVSRQAVYLHFPNRALLGIEAARWFDEKENVARRVAPIVQAATPEATLDAYAEFLGGFNPRLAPIALMMHKLRTLPEMDHAWMDRLQARRGGGGMIAQRVADAGRLRAPLTVKGAGDWITAMGSVLVWSELTQDMGWTTRRYVQHLKTTFHATLLAP